jgi:Ice-binding-like/Bacterial Ig-like domain
MSLQLQSTHNRSLFMRRSISCISAKGWLLTLASSLMITACGGSKDPILGLSNGTTLVPSVSATAPTARNPAITGVAVNTQVTATFNKAMSASTVTGNTFLLACPTGSAVTGNVSYDAASRVATFSPAANLPANTRCVATITTGVQDTTGIALPSAFVWSFETGAAIDTTAPIVINQLPAEGAVAVLNAPITATFSEDMDPATITANSFTLMATVANTPVTGTVTYAVGARTATFTPTSPATLPSNTAFTATVNTAATDLAGNPMAANKVWTFTTAAALDTTAPTVVSQVPAQGAVAVINAPVTATFSEDMAPDTITTSSFTLQTTTGAVPVVGTVTFAAGSRTATFTPLNPSPLPSNTSFTATVTTNATDLAGNPMAANKVWTFNTAAAQDITAPTVISQVPAQGAVAAVNTSVTATFSEDMAPGTITITSFTLKTTVGNTPVAGTVSYATGARTATFTSTSALANDTSYTATVSTVSTDLAGNALAADKVWTFTTAALADTTAPTVTLLSPVLGGTAVCTNKTVNATFSEAMNPLSLTTTTLTLAPSSSLGTPVLAVVSYDAVSKIATITPDATLAPSTAYTATVVGGANGVKDLAGNGMASDTVWSFTTGTSQCQAPLVLGSASNFVILASAAVTDIPTSIITGDVGLTPDTGANITGFSSPGSCPEVVGHVYAVDSAGPACALIDAALLSNAKADALVAFTNATGAGRGTPTPISTNLAGLTFYPGLYESLTSIDLSAGGILTLDAQGDANAVFVIRSATTITTLSTSQVVLSGGAKASNVFWTAGSAITLGANSIMKGSLLAGTAITLQTGANLEGRALNQGPAAAAVSCDACTITLPTP